MTKPVPHHAQTTGAEPASPASVAEMLAPRMAALNLLDSVLNDKQSLDTALDREDLFKNLPQRDRAFCRMLVSTTLRRLGQIDDLIKKAEDKPGQKNLALQNILRLGVAQIMFMNVPDHAAVDTSVRLAQAADMERAKGFVNGLLRTMTRVGKEWLARQDEGRLNTPEWLLKIWIEDYGLRTAAQIAKANMAEAPLDLTVKDYTSKNHWAAVLKATTLGTGTLRLLKAAPVQEMPGFDDGAWWVQDASAAIPAKLFGDVKGKTIVDLCAAPGGKTMQLASMGANVIAIDRSAQRLQRLHENLERLHLADKVKVLPVDAAVWKPPEAPQMILLDAPCTATGTIRRNPDVPHLKTQTDQARLVGLQWQLLENAFRILAPGGIIVFCTCSLQKAEGEDHIARLLDEQPTARKLAITPAEIGGMEGPVTEAGDLRLLPFHNAASGGMDGFFISRIVKDSP